MSKDFRGGSSSDPKVGEVCWPPAPLPNPTHGLHKDESGVLWALLGPVLGVVGLGTIVRSQYVEQTHPKTLPHRQLHPTSSDCLKLYHSLQRILLGGLEWSVILP